MFKESLGPSVNSKFSNTRVPDEGSTSVVLSPPSFCNLPRKCLFEHKSYEEALHVEQILGQLL